MSKTPLDLPVTLPDVEYEKPTWPGRVKRALFGAPRNLGDKKLAHHIALIPLLAWVGLGADGLSSSAYGPEEAFRALGDKTYLVVPLAALVTFTVFILCACYSQIIEHFPHGGGGYLVAMSLLGKKAGLVSGCALLIDYVLTVAVSIAAAGSAIFSLLPPSWQVAKLPVEVFFIVGLVTINIRGIRESVVFLAPIFMTFVVTHLLVIGVGLLGHLGDMPETMGASTAAFKTDLREHGLWEIVLALLFAFSLGGGTFTGIEAVSNGLSIMREPRVQTGKRTMVYMGISLAVVAAGLLICYLLWHVEFREGRTLNAVLFENISLNWPGGTYFVWLTLAAEAALLVVAAQTGFIGGPRILANMAMDSWVPRRFSSLSERLTMQDGIVLMGVTALAALLYTRGKVQLLVIMYSINVFVTFTLAMFGMVRFSMRRDSQGVRNNRELGLFIVGFVLCFLVLLITVVEKFGHGGWLTIVTTGGLVVLCGLVRRHYDSVAQKLKRLDSQLVREAVPFKGTPPAMDKDAPTAGILVANYDGLGIHLLLNIPRVFPGTFKNFVFVSVGVVDSSDFRGEFVFESVRKKREDVGTKYVALANSSGLPAVFRYAIGTEVVDEAVDLCLKLREEFSRLTFFGGKIVFEHERWLEPLLHNQTAFAIQRRLQWSGATMVIMPVRV